MSNMGIFLIIEAIFSLLGMEILRLHDFPEEFSQYTWADALLIVLFLPSFFIILCGNGVSGVFEKLSEIPLFPRNKKQ